MGTEPSQSQDYNANHNNYINFKGMGLVLPLLFKISGLEFLSNKLENLMNSCTY